MCNINIIIINITITKEQLKTVKGSHGDLLLWNQINTKEG